RHTRSTRDWSSDVCSSDLMNITERYRTLPGFVTRERYPFPPFRGTVTVTLEGEEMRYPRRLKKAISGMTTGDPAHYGSRGECQKIGRASCRERGKRRGAEV